MRRHFLAATGHHGTLGEEVGVLVVAFVVFEFRKLDVTVIEECPVLIRFRRHFRGLVEFRTSAAGENADNAKRDCLLHHVNLIPIPKFGTLPEKPEAHSKGAAHISMNCVNRIQSKIKHFND